MRNRLQRLIQSLEPDTLVIGSHGQAVRRLQRVLEELALFAGRVDGYFGEETVLALQRLQQEFGLAETGEFNTATWYALNFWALTNQRSQCGLQVSGLPGWRSRIER